MPPGVEGLWPIMVDSVMMVSVMVSMATSPMTGAASLRRTSDRSPPSSPAFSKASANEWKMPLMFCRVPLMPVVGTVPLGELDSKYGAKTAAALVREAAEVYEKRDLGGGHLAARGGSGSGNALVHGAHDLLHDLSHQSFLIHIPASLYLNETVTA